MRHPRRHKPTTQRKLRERGAERHVVLPQQTAQRARYYKHPSGIGVVQWHAGRFTAHDGDNRTLAPMPAKVRRAFDEASARTKGSK